MDNAEERRLACLTDRQQIVYQLREIQKMKIADIAEEMGVSYNAVRQHISNYKRRLREYDDYQSRQVRNEETVDLPITRGEAIVLIDAISEYRQIIENAVNHGYKTDWIGRLPYEYRIAGELSEKAQMAVYGKIQMEQAWDFEGK